MGRHGSSWDDCWRLVSSVSDDPPARNAVDFRSGQTIKRLRGRAETRETLAKTAFEEGDFRDAAKLALAADEQNRIVVEMLEEMRKTREEAN